MPLAAPKKKKPDGRVAALRALAMSEMKRMGTYFFTSTGIPHHPSREPS